MKKILVFAFISTLASSVYGQAPSDEMQLFQTMFGMAKREIVAEFVKIDDTKSTEFWMLYDEYESNRKQIGQKRFVALNNYVKNYSRLTGAETDKIIQDVIQLSDTQDKLIASYYIKIKK